MNIRIKPEAMTVLEERWSGLSPQEGTELCVCSWCGQMIGRARNDPMIDWDDHIEYCGGCAICEIAVRMWKDDPDRSEKLILELRFHSKCFNEILVPKADSPEVTN